MSAISFDPIVEAATNERLDRALAPLLDRLITPALVLDLDAIEHNVAAMLARVGDPRRWRPHLKTVKQEIAIELLLAAGLRDFKVATLDELALVLAVAGPRELDVLLAYPPTRPVLDGARNLARVHPSARVQLLADSPEHLYELAGWTRADDAPLELQLDVDLGMGRTGSAPERWAELDELPASVRVSGLHGYEGHLRWTDRAEADAAYDRLIALARALGRRHDLALDSLQLVTSGTHGYAHALAHAELARGPWKHQVSPGTIVLSDGRSHAAAADLGLRQAAFVASRVISTGPGRVTLDAGSKAITPDGEPPSCRVLARPELEPQRASEEHLPCLVAPEGEAPARGRLVWLIPEHVCTTVNLHREALWIRGDACIGRGSVAAAGHSIEPPVVE